MLRPLALAAGVSAALAALGATLPVVEAQPAHHAAGACFYLRNINGSKLADARNYYVRTDSGRVFHIEFGSDCLTAHTYPLVVSAVDNSGEICNAIGLNVTVRDTGESCIPTRLNLLSPDEVAALPPNARP